MKFFIAIVLIFLSVGPAEAFMIKGAASPTIGTLSIDGTPVTVSLTATNPGTITYSTTQTNDIIVIVIYASNSALTPISTITDSSGLTWVKRKALTVASNNSLEEWYAVSPGIQTNDVVTYTAVAGGTGVGFRTGIYAVHGANQTTPFDPNGSLPASLAQTTGSSVAVTVSTTKASDMLIAALRSVGALGTIGYPSGFSSILTAGADEDLSKNIVSAIQSSVVNTFTFSGGSTANGLIVDAIQASGQ